MNIKWSHSAESLWEVCVTGNPHQLNPSEYDWEKNEGEE